MDQRGKMQEAGSHCLSNVYSQQGVNGDHDSTFWNETDSLLKQSYNTQFYGCAVNPVKVEIDLFMEGSFAGT